ncbi:MAG: hypothetical protein VKJ02_09190 [Snowella sp.]|nr:hypothetical protein [Snowella sp.]
MGIVEITAVINGNIRPFLGKPNRDRLPNSLFVLRYQNIFSCILSSLISDAITVV